ncbi:hypothetical protein ACSQ67_004352 [Phaseolus vulgaris]
MLQTHAHVLDRRVAGQDEGRGGRAMVLCNDVLEGNVQGIQSFSEQVHEASKDLKKTLGPNLPLGFYSGDERVVRESKKEGEAFKYGLARRSNEVADKCGWFWFMQKDSLKAVWSAVFNAAGRERESHTLLLCSMLRAIVWREQRELVRPTLEDRVFTGGEYWREFKHSYACDWIC